MGYSKDQINRLASESSWMQLNRNVHYASAGEMWLWRFGVFGGAPHGVDMTSHRSYVLEKLYRALAPYYDMAQLMGAVLLPVPAGLGLLDQWGDEFEATDATWIVDVVVRSVDSNSFTFLRSNLEDRARQLLSGWGGSAPLVRLLAKEYGDADTQTNAAFRFWASQPPLIQFNDEDYAQELDALSAARRASTASLEPFTVGYGFSLGLADYVDGLEPIVIGASSGAQPDPGGGGGGGSPPTTIATSTTPTAGLSPAAGWAVFLGAALAGYAIYDRFAPKRS